ncbi:hypothetical protein T484DRAFT_1902530 [Baffinella frigidus]|nr:hypothetical protein T484DRAFT_1902530 [Cryptophyta sp. CCMP2293]
MQGLIGLSKLTYILQARDRGIAALLLGKEGHVTCLEFSHILEASSAPHVRLRPEMMGLLGGSVSAEAFKYFCSLVVRAFLAIRGLLGGSVSAEAFKYLCSLVVGAFLAVRAHSDELIGLVAAMQESGVPGVRREAVEALRARLVPEKNEREAAQVMLSRLRESQEHSSSAYEMFQAWATDAD